MMRSGSLRHLHLSAAFGAAIVLARVLASSGIGQQQDNIGGADRVLSDLPDALLTEIMYGLEPIELARLAVTSRRFWGLATSLPHWTFMALFEEKTSDEAVPDLLQRLSGQISSCPGLRMPSRFLRYHQIILLYDRLFSDMPDQLSFDSDQQLSDIADRFRAIPLLIRGLNLPEIFAISLCDIHSSFWCHIRTPDRIDCLITVMEPLCYIAQDLNLHLTVTNIPELILDFITDFTDQLESMYSPIPSLEPTILAIRSVFPAPFNKLFPFNSIASRHLFTALLESIPLERNPLTNPSINILLLKVGIRFTMQEIARLNLPIEDTRLPALMALAQPFKIDLDVNNCSDAISLLERFPQLDQYVTGVAPSFKYMPVLYRVPAFVLFLRRNPEQLHAAAAVLARDRDWDGLQALFQHAQRELLAYPQFRALVCDLDEILLTHGTDGDLVSARALISAG